jgi:hypothetical protein
MRRQRRCPALDKESNGARLSCDACHRRERFIAFIVWAWLEKEYVHEQAAEES